MKNNYGLPKIELQKIFERDKVCVYCKKQMKSHEVNNQRADWFTIEHLNYVPPWNNPMTVTICCWSCNSSRGNKKIRDWFKTTYCVDKNINEKTVSKPVQKYIIEVEDNE
jgi:hypothetical protein